MSQAGAQGSKPSRFTPPTHTTRMLVFPLFDPITTDGPTNKRTAPIRFACPQLKNSKATQFFIHPWIILILYVMYKALNFGPYQSTVSLLKLVNSVTHDSCFTFHFQPQPPSWVKTLLGARPLKNSFRFYKSWYSSLDLLSKVLCQTYWILVWMRSTLSLLSAHPLSWKVRQFVGGILRLLRTDT